MASPTFFPEGHQPSSDIARGCILSVDDEPVILITRGEILTRAGYRVINASTGEEALSLFADDSVELVVLDYRLPEMDGGQVALKMKQLKPNVPIIIVSAYVKETSLIACADCFVQKGESPTLLLHEIDRLLARRPKA